MQELSLNILDIAENSTRAEATLVEIELVQNTVAKLQTLVIRDNGRGMDEKMVGRVTDPFCTTRTTRKVGLGLPFLKMAAEMTGGGMHVESEVGVGTTVTADFGLGHIDLMPLGDIAGTVVALVQSNPDTDFVFLMQRDEAVFRFDTREVREILGGVPLGEPQVAMFLKEYITGGTEAVLRGETPTQ